MAHIAWPEITAFYNIRKYAAAHPEILNGDSAVKYLAKIKLHGTNAAVQVHEDGTVLAQSRETMLTAEKDNAGFAKWALAQNWKPATGYVVFGEWCGSGVQKGVAISNIGKKVFAVFAAKPLDGSDKLVVEPDDLEQIVRDVSPDVYVLPWYSRPCHQDCDTRTYAQANIDWSKSADELNKDTEIINQWVADVEANDPWVDATFNVKGTGEGLVFYPVSELHLGSTNYNNLVFKAKGEAHKNIKTAKPAQVNAETAANVSAFVDMVLTTARLDQGARDVGGFDITLGLTSFDMKLTGKFVAWVLADVQKEAQDELAASGLDWKSVQKPLTDKARNWYMEQAKK